MSRDGGAVPGGVTDVAGVRVGHWTDPVGLTGCTVVLLPAGSVASGEVRGGAPGTREWALLDPRRTVSAVNAVVLTGGSAFGLASCDGVVRWCEERGIGYAAPAGAVPIVVGMVIYDLGTGDPRARPGPAEGYAACDAAQAGGAGQVRGRIGAGAGATVGKWRGRDAAKPAGIGSWAVTDGELVVAALMVANALGEPRGDGEERPRVPVGPGLAPDPGTPHSGTPHSGTPHSGTGGGGLDATTIGVVVTNAALDKLGCRLVAESSHDGVARALEPAHTAADGDAVVVAATGPVRADVEAVRAMAAWVVERAILDGCRATA